MNRSPTLIVPLSTYEGVAGPFAIDVKRFERGDPDTLFRLLVSTVMFQRRRDVVIFRFQLSLTALFRDQPAVADLTA